VITYKIPSSSIWRSWQQFFIIVWPA
jgi:hypothetical protein